MATAVARRGLASVFNSLLFSSATRAARRNCQHASRSTQTVRAPTTKTLILYTKKCFSEYTPYIYSHRHTQLSKKEKVNIIH